MEEIFYVGWCPICREYGRLEINKDITNNEYLIRCEECLAEWKNPQDAFKNINGRRCSKEREIRSATRNEIKSLRWDKFLVENFDEYERLDKVYELIRKTGYIQSINIYRDMDHKSIKEYNLVLVLSTCPSYDGDMKVKLVFYDVQEFKMGDINNFFKIFLEILDVSDRQSEDIRYYVNEIEHSMISFWCSDIEYEIEIV